MHRNCNSFNISRYKHIMNQCEEKLHSALSACFYMQPFLTFIFFQSLHSQSLWSQSQKKYTWIMKPPFNPKLNYCYLSCIKIPQCLWITKLTKGFVLQTHWNMANMPKNETNLQCTSKCSYNYVDQSLKKSMVQYSK